MKKYTYQIIRYMPDRVTGEFVNVGLLVFNKEEIFLKADTLSRIGRVKYLFPDVKSSYLIKNLKSIKVSINTLGASFVSNSNAAIYNTIESISSTVIPVDDSSIYCSEVFAGIDTNLENAFDDLFYQFVEKYEPKSTAYLTDKEVWSKHYKSIFENYNFGNGLESRTVQTDGNSLEFKHAVKNGKWNYLEPITFDLSKPANIKEKVYKWMGRLKELDSSSENFSLYLLSVLPKDKELKSFIKNRILDCNGDNFDVAIIEPSGADQLAKKLASQMEN